MESAYIKGFDTILDKVTQSVEKRPWMRPLYWVVVVAGILLATIVGALTGLLEESGETSHHNTQTHDEENLDEYESLLHAEHHHKDDSSLNYW